jgi:hypothetical protein
MPANFIRVIGSDKIFGTDHFATIPDPEGG